MKNPLTIEAFADWLEKQPPEKEYDYSNCRGCLVFQYLTAVGIPITSTGSTTFSTNDGQEHILPYELDIVAARHPHTFGKAAIRARRPIQ